ALMIGQVDRRRVEDSPATYTRAADRSGLADGKRGERRTVFCHLTHTATFDLVQRYIARATQPCRILDGGFQYRLNVRRRVRDDSQNLCGRRLSLQSFLRLVEQPHVLDRDDSLVGESLQKFDLAFAKGANIAPPHAYQANRRAFSDQRYTEARSPPRIL